MVAIVVFAVAIGVLAISAFNRTVRNAIYQRRSTAALFVLALTVAVGFADGPPWIKIVVGLFALVPVAISIAQNEGGQRDKWCAIFARWGIRVPQTK